MSQSLQATARELQNQRVFFFHPQRGWDLGVVNSTSIAETRAGTAQLVVTLRSVDDDQLVDAVYRNGLMFQPTSSMQGALVSPPDNLLLLPELHNAVVVHALKLRHAKDVVYTGLGELIVALNPFKYSIPWYQDECAREYLAHLDRAELPSVVRPHVWSVAHRAYVDMRRIGANHSIIISGESGSGKTESCKSMIRYLCSVSEHRATRHAAALRAIHRINVRVQLSNVILESFGNAKTLRNDNSSRFGKFTEVQFNAAGVLVGMRTTPFLLERSRVVRCALDERVFHCFYQLAAGGPKDLLQRFQIRTPRDFELLTQGKCVSLKSNGIDDAEDFVKVCRAFKALQFSNDEVDVVWRIVAAIMHLVNVKFAEPQHSPFGASTLGSGGKGSSMQADAAQLLPASQDLVFFVAKELLQLTEPQRLAEALVSTTVAVKGEVVVRHLTTHRAMDQRDAVCKLLYTKLFQWIVEKINSSTSSDAPDEEDGETTQSPQHEAEPAATLEDSALVKDRNAVSWIALLDIFGFEDFPINSFEQLCINLANEALQRHYTRHTFIQDTEAMRLEGISTTQVKFVDNLPCVELLQGVKNSVISVLDDCSVLDLDRSAQNASTGSSPDATFLAKLTQLHRPDYQTAGAKGSKSVLDRSGPTASADAHPLEKPSDFFQRGRLDQDSFTIKHYAGDVKYKVDGFVEKNMDVVRDSSMSVLMSSQCEILRSILEMDDNIGLLAEGNRAGSPLRAASPGSPRGFSSGSNSANAKSRTVASTFRNSLKTLMQTLDESQPHWVRCVRPHIRKAPNLFDGKLVLEQLVAAGVLSTIEQRQRNFPFRMLHLEFVERFGVLARSVLRRMGSRSTNGERCSAILSCLAQRSAASPDGDQSPQPPLVSAASIRDSDAQVGRSRVFVSAETIRLLESARSEVLHQNVVVVSMFLRCFTARKQVCYIIWTMHAVKCQRIARRTLRIRRAVKLYYEELRQRIIERHVQQQKDVIHSEAKVRPRLAVDEQSQFAELARTFQVQLLPMIATVLKNIRVVESETREEMLQDLQKAYWMLEATFADGVDRAHARHRERLQREHQQRTLARQKMWDSCVELRLVTSQQEAEERRLLQTNLAPHLAVCHEAVARLVQQQKQRDAEILRLQHLRDEELRRLAREERKRRDEEALVWRQFIGEEAYLRDVAAWRHAESSSTRHPSGARHAFMQEFYGSRLPSQLIRSPETMGSIRGMDDVAKALQASYENDLMRRLGSAGGSRDAFLAKELLAQPAATQNAACIALPAPLLSHLMLTPVRQPAGISDRLNSSTTTPSSYSGSSRRRAAFSSAGKEAIDSSDDEGALLAELSKSATKRYR